MEEKYFEERRESGAKRTEIEENDEIADAPHYCESVQAGIHRISRFDPEKFKRRSEERSQMPAGGEAPTSDGGGGGGTADKRGTTVDME